MLSRKYVDVNNTGIMGEETSETPATQLNRHASF